MINTSFTKPFNSGCGICRPSTDYVNYYKATGGGNGQYEDVVGAKVMIPKGVSVTPMTAPTATTLLNRSNDPNFVNQNLGINWATTGGSKHNFTKNMKMKKGALHKHLKVPKTYKFRPSTIERLSKVKNGNKFDFRDNKFVMTKKLKDEIALAKAFETMRKDKKNKHHHKHHHHIRHHHKGGDTNWGATGMPQDFYSPRVLNGYSEDSGFGVKTAYGESSPLDAGVGNLAPFNVAKGAAPLSMQQTGGKKRGRKGRKQRGGDTNWGATGMPQRYYNPNMEQMNYSSNSGAGVPTAYGASSPLDAGVGNLAPFNVAKGAAPLSMQQTGGKKKRRGRRTKKQRGGTFKIKDQPVKGIVNGLDSVVDSVVSKFNQLNESMASFDTKMSEMLKTGGSKKSKRNHNKNLHNKRHKNRPSPTETATEHKVGKKKKGNDGNMWKVVKTKKGVKRWQKVSKNMSKKKSSLKKK